MAKNRSRTLFEIFRLPSWDAELEFLYARIINKYVALKVLKNLNFEYNKI